MSTKLYGCLWIGLQPDCHQCRWNLLISLLNFLAKFAVDASWPLRQLQGEIRWWAIYSISTSTKFCHSPGTSRHTTHRTAVCQLGSKCRSFGLSFISMATRTLPMHPSIKSPRSSQSSGEHNKSMHSDWYDLWCWWHWPESNDVRVAAPAERHQVYECKPNWDWKRKRSEEIGTKVCCVDIELDVSLKFIYKKSINSFRLLTCCWDSMVIILSAGLGESEDSRAKKIVKFSQKHLKVGSNNSRRHNGQAALYALSLEGLHAVSWEWIDVKKLFLT